MKHKNDIPERLTAYLDGELTPEEARAVEQAVAADADLAKELSRLQAVRKLVRQLPREKTGPDFVQRVMERAERVTLVSEPAAAPEKVILPWARHLATAALVLIAVAVGGVIALTIYKTPDIRKTLAGKNTPAANRPTADSGDAEGPLARAVPDESRLKEADGTRALDQPLGYSTELAIHKDDALRRAAGKGAETYLYRIDTPNVQLARAEVQKLLGPVAMERGAAPAVEGSDSNRGASETMEFRIKAPAEKVRQLRDDLDQICQNARGELKRDVKPEDTAGMGTRTCELAATRQEETLQGGVESQGERKAEKTSAEIIAKAPGMGSGNEQPAAKPSTPGLPKGKTIASSRPEELANASPGASAPGGLVAPSGMPTSAPTPAIGLIAGPAGGPAKGAVPDRIASMPATEPRTSADAVRELAKSSTTVDAAGQREVEFVIIFQQVAKAKEAAVAATSSPAYAPATAPAAAGPTSDAAKK